MIDFFALHKYSIIGFGVCKYIAVEIVNIRYYKGFWLSRRVSTNMFELEKNTQEKKLFDPLKAKAQIQVYKEIYNFEGQDGDKEGQLRIMQSASKEDKENINKFFDKSTKKALDKNIDEEMEQLKKEIDSLEEVTSGHQGFKFYRTIMTKDTFEDALIELREKEFDKKFRQDKEMLVGDKPKTV